MVNARLLRVSTLPLAMLLALAPVASVAQNVGDSIPLTFDDGAGNTLLYRLFLPPGHGDPEKAFPLTVFLHGSGQVGADNVSQLLFIDGLIEATQSDRFASFLLVPQSQPGQGGWSPLTFGMTVGVMEQLEQQYSIDSSRRYLTGLSMGGFGTWGAIAALPDLFEAAVPMSAWGDPAAAEQYVKTRVWSFHGRGDNLPAEFNRETILAIEAAGGSPLYTETNGGHVIWEPIYNDPDGDLYPWLFEGVEPSLGTLSYNPHTGSTQIDAGAAPGGAINFLRLFARPGTFNLPDTVTIDGVVTDFADLFDSNERSIRYDGNGGPGLTGVLDLGTLLPTGLDFNELHEIFLLKEYRSPSTVAARTLSLKIVVPEPSSVLSAAIACCGALGFVALSASRRGSTRSS